MNPPLIELTPEQAEKKRRHKIALIVAICHVVLIGGPLLWYLVSQWLKTEPPKTIQVKLVAPSSSSSGSQSSFEPTNTKFEPVNIPDPPSRVTPPKPNKKKVIEKPKSIEKPNPTQKPKPKPEPPKKPYLSATDIEISKTIVKRNRQETKPKIVKTTNKVVVSNRPPAKTQEQLEAELRAALSQQSNANTAVGTPQDGIESMKVSYAQRVGAYLRPRWDQPSRYDVGGRHPEVTIRLRVSAYGVVTSSEILRASGVSAMDRSVQKLLYSLRRVPAPPSGVDHIDLIMALEDQ